MPDPVVSVADLKTHLGITGPTDDALLALLETNAVDFFERETSRFFGDAASYTEYIIGQGTARLWLAEHPDDGVIPATVSERAKPSDTATTITATAATGYVMRTSETNITYLLRKGSSVWREGWEYEVTYSRGYTTLSVPGDVLQAVVDLVGIAYERSKKGAIGTLKSETLGDYSYTLADPASADGNGIASRQESVRHTINNWRRDTF